MDYILTHGKLMPTARIVRDSLQEKLGTKILITTDTDVLNKNSRRVILRWGNSFPVSVTDISIQRPELIQLLSFKKNLSERLSVVEEKIPTPIFQKTTPEDFPVIIRESLSLCKGKGIHVVKNLDEFNSLWQPIFYWAKFFSTSAEYRTHIVGGKVVKIFKKVSGETVEEFPIRTNENYHFSLCNTEKCPQLVAFAEKAAKIISSDGFYALDIGKTSDGFVVFEGNSAPGLNELTCDFYTSYIVEKLNEILRPREIEG